MSSPGTSVSTLGLALRRWSASLTLSSPSSLADAQPYLAWGMAFLLLLLVAIFAQGPGRALGQCLNIPGNLRLFGQAMQRLRRSGRLLAITFGVAVVSWTFNQLIRFRDPSGRDEMIQLLRGRQLTELSLSQGVLAGLTPFRDVAALGMMLPLLLAATVLLFQYATDRWNVPMGLNPWHRLRLSRWATVGWIGASIYALYRFVGMVSGSGDLPLGGCVYIEGVVVPPIMAIADGLLLAWVVVEIRNAGLGDQERDLFDMAGLIKLIPAAILTVVLIHPGRYVSAFLVLTTQYLPAGSVSTTLAPWIRWSLGWGVISLQVVALCFSGMLGALAWSQGTLSDVWKAQVRLLKAEAGHLVGVVLLASLLTGAFSALAYILLLSLPAQSWVLSSADSYAHYASLLIGLALLAALIELGERSLPVADLASTDVHEQSHNEPGASLQEASKPNDAEIVIL